MPERDWTRQGATSARPRITSCKSRSLTLGLVEKKRRSVRHGARSILSRLPRTHCRVRGSPPPCRWFTRGRVSATAHWSNLKLSRQFPERGPHTAISASIRAGILCAVTNASTRSLPQPRLPADSLPRRSLAKAGSPHTKRDRSALSRVYRSGERRLQACWFRLLAETNLTEGN